MRSEMENTEELKNFARKWLIESAQDYDYLDLVDRLYADFGFLPPNDEVAARKIEDLISTATITVTLEGETYE